MTQLDKMLDLTTAGVRDLYEFDVAKGDPDAVTLPVVRYTNDRLDVVVIPTVVDGVLEVAVYGYRDGDERKNETLIMRA